MENSKNSLYLYYVIHNTKLPKIAIMKSFLSSACILALCLLFSTTSWGQATRLSGKIVSDPDAKPLQGVSVVVKGKAGGTQTDADGSFSLDAAPGDVLVFSFTVYATQ